MSLRVVLQLDLCLVGPDQPHILQVLLPSDQLLRVVVLVVLDAQACLALGVHVDVQLYTGVSLL